MKKIFRILAMFLAVVLLMPLLGVRSADATCGTDEWDGKTPFDYRKVGSAGSAIDTYAKCKYCGDWFLYCGQREHTWYTAESHRATCTRDGYDVYKCKRCGASFKYVTKKATGHRWGEWICTVAATATAPGEEQRECSVCHATETRRIEPTDIYAHAGDSDFTVLVAKELLRREGGYDGTIDRTLDAAFQSALKAYQKKVGLDETGELTVMTLEVLALRFAFDFDEILPADGLLHEFPSGLTAYADYDSTYVSNGDGTHERTSTWRAVRFALGGEEWVYGMPAYMQITIAPVHEPCRTANESHTCPCGFTESLLTAFAYFEPLLSDGCMIVTYDLTDLPPIENLWYDEKCSEEILWDEFPDAMYYLIDVACCEDPEQDLVAAGHFMMFANYLPMFGTPAGEYEVGVQAFNEDDEPISEWTAIGFTKANDNALSGPENPELYDGVVLWDDINLFADVSFRVRLWAIDLNENVVWSSTHETENCYYDFTQEIIRQQNVTVGMEMKAAVLTFDPAGRYADTEESETSTEMWNPKNAYRVNTAVNVRSGPGKNYPRVGGLSRGDIVFTYGTEPGEDGETYLIISYNDNNGYVNAAFLQSILLYRRRIFVDFGNGTVVPVLSGVDDRIDVGIVEEEARKPENGRIGWRLTGFSNITLDQVLDTDMTVYTEWERDSAYVWVTLHDGNSTKEVPVPVGQTYPELFGQNDSRIWTTEPDGMGKLVTVSTRFTRDMTDLYASTVGHTEIVLGAYANNCAPVLRQLYANADHNSASRGQLQANDILEVRGTASSGAEVLTVSEGQIPISGQYFKVYSYRLEREGYILAELLYGSEHKPPTVHFDANGGTGAPQEMLPSYDGGYRIKTYPTPRRDGFLFLGWQDQNGVFCNADTRFTELHVYLTAVWEPEAPRSKRPAVVCADDGAANAYYSDTCDGRLNRAIPHGSEVQIIGWNDERYECLFNGKRIWLLQDNVEYYKYVLIGYYSVCYADRNRKTGIAVPRDREIKLYVISTAYEMEHVISPDYTDCSDFWVDRRGLSERGKSQITVCFDAGAGYCSIESMTLTGVNTSSEYDKKTGKTYYRMAADRIPLAYCSGYRFIGWYTEPIGGVPVDASTVFTPQEHAKDNLYMLYAHYESLYDGRVFVANGEIPRFEPYGSGMIRTSKTVPKGAVLIASQMDESAAYLRVTYRSKTFWVLRSDVIEGEQRQITHVEYKTDRDVRARADKNSTAYYRLRPGETFVVVGEKNGYYRIAYEDGDTGFAYVSKRHFY